MEEQRSRNSERTREGTPNVSHTHVKTRARGVRTESRWEAGSSRALTAAAGTLAGISVSPRGPPTRRLLAAGSRVLWP